LYNTIANYSFEVEFIKGTNNFIVDYVSKNHNEELVNKQLIEIKFLQEFTDPPKRGEWVTIAKKAQKASNQRPNKVYVVFKGFQSRSFTTWKQCHSQVNGFKGACYKAYNTFDEGN
jgi:hypothetical protein